MLDPEVVKKVLLLESSMKAYETLGLSGTASKAELRRHETGIKKAVSNLSPFVRQGVLDHRFRDSPRRVLQAIRCVEALGLDRGMEASFITVRGQRD